MFLCFWGVQITLRNGGAAHWLPTGVSDIREPWIELQTKDAAGNVLDHIGGPTSATGGLLPPGATPEDPPPSGGVPALGAHTEAILASLGYSADAIARLRADKAI